MACRKPFILPGLSFLSLLLCLAGCGAKKAEVQQPGPGASVTVAQVSLQDVPLELRAIGNVESYSTVQIKSQINAQLMTVHFREGQEVREGDLLFTLDDRQLVADVSKAESQVRRDEAVTANARAKAVRYTELNQQGVISKQDYDEVRTEAESNAALVQSDKAALESAKVQVTYSKIYSPIQGRTGALTVNAGNQLKANDVPLVTINQINPIYVSFTVPEQQLADLKQHLSRGKLRVTALINGDRIHPESGTLSFIDNSVNMQTGTIRLKASFANEDKRLWPGQFVDVVLTLALQAGRTVVPSRAVQTGQTGQYIFVVKADHTVEARPVAVQRIYNELSVVATGLREGETVVTDGQLRLAPNSKVEIKSASEEAAKPITTNAGSAGESLEVGVGPSSGTAGGRQ